LYAVHQIFFHPAVYSENLKNITGSWNQLNAEAKLFSDPEVKKFFSDNGIIITTWTEVMKNFETQKH
jgi:hypothetical protein